MACFYFFGDSFLSNKYISFLRSFIFVFYYLQYDTSINVKNTYKTKQSQWISLHNQPNKRIKDFKNILIFIYLLILYSLEKWNGLNKSNNNIKDESYLTSYQWLVTHNILSHFLLSFPDLFFLIIEFTLSNCFQSVLF